MSALLQLRNIEAHYGPVTAVSGVSLQVEAGSIVAVLGANGAGKTTVLKTVAGLLDPTKGMVLFEGRPIHGLRPDRVTKLGISLVPEGRQVFPLLSVHENLVMGAYTRRAGRSLAQDLDAIYALFPPLVARRSSPGGRLSGGEQQMLAIGRALMARPRLLLLDEPSLGLSPLYTTEVFDLLRKIRDQWNATIVVVEQNAAQALRVADFGYVLELGRVVLSDIAVNLLAHRDIRTFFLGGAADEAVPQHRRWRPRKTWS